VTIGIGGNDVQFSDVVKGCIVTTGPCSSPSFYLTRDGKVDPKPLYLEEPERIRALRGSLQALYKTIKSKVSPNARIVVVGYPRLFVSSPTSPCNLITVADQIMLNSFADLLSDTIKTEAQAAGVTFYDPHTRYEGHRVCETAEAVSGTILSSSTGSSPWNSTLQKYVDIVGRGSWHPKAAGHALVATDIRALLGL
jgi:hypothetical protein